MNTTQLFDTLTADYQAYRPDYPAEARDWLKSFGAMPTAILDVGAGTGILTRQLRETFGPGPRITGVEPGHGMLATARAATPAAMDIVFVEAPAEALPAPAASVQLVTVAQALHWFDRPRFYAECARVLAPGGTFAVFVNDRDRADPLVANYEAIIGQDEDDSATGADRAGLGLSLMRDGVFRREIDALAAFAGANERQFTWQRAMSVEALVGMGLSSVRMQNAMRRHGADAVVSRVRAIAEQHADGDGAVIVSFVTTVIAARRRQGDSRPCRPN